MESGRIKFPPAAPCEANSILSHCSIRTRTGRMSGGASLALLGNSGGEKGSTGTDGGAVTFVREVLSAHSLTSIFTDNPIIQTFRRLKDKSSARALTRNRSEESKLQPSEEIEW